MNIGDLIMTSIETITAFDISTGAYKWQLDELQDASVAQTEEKVDITGKQGRKLSSIKRNKAVTVSATNGILSCGLLESQTGSSFKNGATTVEWRDYITVPSEGDVKTQYKAVGTAGDEITAIYVRNTDGSLGTMFTQDSAAAAGKFAYDPSTKVITFGTDKPAAGTELVAMYKRKITADALDNSSDTYSEKVELFIDALAENRCNEVYHVQIHVPRADVSGEFTIEFGDNQTVHAFEAEALASRCYGSNFFTFIVFGANAEDVE